MLTQIRKLVLLAFLIPLLFFVPSIYASHIPAPTGYVNDFSGILTSDQKITLENSLKNFTKQSGNEIAIALVNSLNGDAIENFTVKTFEEWKIGKKGKDNGVLFLAAINDKKMRIEVGYGAEPYLTDSKAGEIIRNIIAPKFQQKDYYGGLSAGVSEIEKQLSSNPEPVSNINAQTKIPSDLTLLITIAIFAFIYLSSFMARSKSIWLGGILGSVIGSIISVGIISVIIFGLLGLLFDWVLSRTYNKLKAGGHNTGWLATGGGFWGSKESGIGFGGFGGGGSGGGGSSGSW